MFVASNFVTALLYVKQQFCNPARTKSFVIGYRGHHDTEQEPKVALFNKEGATILSKNQKCKGGGGMELCAPQFFRPSPHMLASEQNKLGNIALKRQL